MSLSKNSSSSLKKVGPMPLRESAYRYLFYGWLFRDADTGTELERASALRHNRHQARWLPVYLLRWSVIGGVFVGMETHARPLNSVPVLSAALAVGLIFVVMYLILTTIFWAFLRGSRGQASND
ncbi:hypothetical protein [Rhizobacter sp. Root404]|uniref:hypothetical protein n=1 Tax=Rhizobacter sp. Root404 TaxID=1736528 RepID=UPI0012F8510E|nr:hypothetical protein [Rhizobacter sp. Root404]